ncbi:MAG: methyltransferase domain-containing protein [Salibacteraceae bacterium]
MQRQHKEALKNRLPSFVFSVYHSLRILIIDIGYAWAKVQLVGKTVTCPVCERSFRAFRPGGKGIEILKQYQVVGAGFRLNSICPHCRSKERDRLLWLYLNDYSSLLATPIRLLHMAPEVSLKPVFQNHPNVEYLNGDLDPKLADLELDLTQLDFQDESLDALICNHVLEHIPDDRRAMREVLRVLKPGGWAILQVPIAQKLDTTIEDPELEDPVEREKRFGQYDHVRIYGKDYGERLKSCGFDLTVVTPESLVAEEGIWKYALLRKEHLFVARKPRQ